VLRPEKRLRDVPRAYLVGPILFALAVGLLVVSLTVETGIVGTAFEIGEAPPGIADHNVSFRATSLFYAHLVTGDCGVEFHLLNDSAYGAYQSTGSLHSRPSIAAGGKLRWKAESVTSSRAMRPLRAARTPAMSSALHSSDPERLTPSSQSPGQGSHSP